MSSPELSTPQPSRRRFTFSLRTLLILMVLASLALTFIAHPLYQWRQQELLVKEIRKRNPSLQIGYGSVSQPSRWVENFTIQSSSELWILREHKLPMLSGLRRLDLREPKIENKDLANLQGCTSLRGLGLEWKEFDDRAIEHLKHLPNLEQIGFSNCSITDRGVEELAKLSKLQSVFICETKVADQGFTHLAKLPNLSRLSLWNCQVSDTTIQLFAKKPTLTNLTLNHSPVTGNFGLSEGDWPKLIQFSANSTSFNDNGLSHLAKCKLVKHLHLFETKITDGAIPLLLQLPNLENLDISSEHLTIDGLRKLSGHPNLRDLNLRGDFSNEEIKALAKSMKRPFQEIFYKNNRYRR